MRKRSSYRPKGMVYDTMGYVIESLTPVAAHGSVLIDLKLKNHVALATTTQGRADRKTIDVLIAALNMTETLYKKGFGDVEEHGPLVKAGMHALRSLGARGADTGKFIMRSDEMAALNEAMQLHDEQLEIVTVGELDRSQRIVRDVLMSKKVKVINDNEKSK